MTGAPPHATVESPREGISFGGDTNVCKRAAVSACKVGRGAAAAPSGDHGRRRQRGGDRLAMAMQRTSEETGVMRGSGFGRVDDASDPSSFVTYLDAASATIWVRVYKQQAITLLDV